MDFDQRVRVQVYAMTTRDGVPPSRARLAQALGESEPATAAALRRLADAHMLVLQRDADEILMAGPFSAVPTPFRVTLSRFTTYGNCIWDALGIAAMLRADARIDTSCADCGVAVRIDVREGDVHHDGFMHFALPPKVWWEDIVFT